MDFQEFRSGELARTVLADIRRIVTKRWTIMEVCGGQTHAILHSGIDQLLPTDIRLIHGPGCPVCVTPIDLIDRAIDLCDSPETVLATFGDMLRVPGTRGNLFEARAAGGRVEIVGSALQALEYARLHPELRVVFFAIGFETTAPSTALAIKQADREQITNFQILCAHVLVRPAMVSLVCGPGRLVQAYLAAGHVATIMGEQDYQSLARDYHVPVIITGFESVDLLLGIRAAVRQLEAGEAKVENMYSRVVRPGGNQSARAVLNEVFESEDREWRGIGMIAGSGLRLREAFRKFDAPNGAAQGTKVIRCSGACVAGEVLQGLKRPNDCPAFGTACTPASPLGAPMVSSEGTCAAYYANHRRGVHVGQA